MSLIDSFMEDCIILNKVKTADGAGGFNVAWEEGDTFKAAITLDSSMTARIAEHDGVTSTYTITTRKALKLDFHDVIRRVSDGKTFRITSDKLDKESPDSGSLDIAQVTAEKWELTS